MQTPSTSRLSYLAQNRLYLVFTVHVYNVLGQVVHHWVVGEQLGEGEAPDLYEVSVIVITAENLPQNNVIMSVTHKQDKVFLALSA